MSDPRVPRRPALSLLLDDSHDYVRGLKTPHDPPDTPDETRETERHKVILETALDRFRLVCELERDQRQREVEDLRFDRALVEDQWPEDALRARAGGVGPDGKVVPARPCLVISKVDQPVQQVVNEGRKARLAIIIKPKGNGADTQGAELRQGMIRAIEQDSRASLARMWAFERATKCGRGAYRVLKIYANDGDFDIDLVVARIKNQGCVYLDPYAQEPDWSDGEWAFITDDMPIKEYQRIYQKTAMASKSAEELQSISDKSPGWVTTGGKDGEGTIRVAEYFYVEYEPRVLIQDPATGQNRLLPAGDPVPEGVTVQRPVEKRQVHWCVINAVEVLDEEDWEGRYIPIIPTVGKEYNVDGTSCWKGVVSNAKHAQRLYNFARSSQAMRAGLESLAPWVMAEGQDEGYEAMWDEANTRAFTRLIYKPTTFEGHLVGPPQRNDLSSTNLSASMLMAREADMDIQATTGRFNPSLGKEKSSQSGRAIDALKMQGESSSSNYLENLATISMTYEAKVLLDLLQYVYDRPGRIVRLLGDDPKDAREVILHQPSVTGPEGRPVSAAPNTPGLIPMLLKKLRGGTTPEPATKYDLSTGDYTVTVAVGSSFANQKDANSAVLANLMQSAPGLTPVLADIYAEQIDGPMSDRIVKRLQKMNPQLADEGDGPQPIPEAAQQQMAQMQQQLQQMGQAFQQLQQEVQSEHAKIAAQVQMKGMELESRERIASAQVMADVAKTKAEIESRESLAGFDADSDHAKQLAQQDHETALQQQKTQDATAQKSLGIGPLYKPSPATFTPPDDTTW